MYEASLPFNLRLLNVAGKTLSLLGLRGVSLTPRSLMKRARRNTNLNDFGPDDFREGLDCLSESLEKEASLTPFGRMVAQAELLHLLENRLKLIHAFKVNRELSGAPVTRPLIITGLPQSGTTLLHSLLAQDPDNRTPASWEMRYPFPPPRTETYFSDSRIAKVDRELKNAQLLMPELKRLYPMGARRPQECVSITAMNFMAMSFNVNYRVPSYQHWLSHNADVRGGYDLHYQFLQYLQWRHKGERWVLMSPGHLWHLDKLLQRYPDAMVVQVHRDPLKAVSALSNLTYTLRSVASNAVDMREISRYQADLLDEGLTRNMTQRNTGLRTREPILDLHYSDVTADPLAAVEQIYRHFSLPLSATTRETMAVWQTQHDYEQIDRHRYLFTATGLRLEEERKRFKTYQDAFHIAQERL